MDDQQQDTPARDETPEELLEVQEQLTQTVQPESSESGDNSEPALTDIEQQIAAEFNENREAENDDSGEETPVDAAQEQPASEPEDVSVPVAVNSPEPADPEPVQVPEPQVIETQQEPEEMSVPVQVKTTADPEQPQAVSESAADQTTNIAVNVASAVPDESSAESLNESEQPAAPEPAPEKPAPKPTKPVFAPPRESTKVMQDVVPPAAVVNPQPQSPEETPEQDPSGDTPDDVMEQLQQEEDAEAPQISTPESVSGIEMEPEPEELPVASDEPHMTQKPPRDNTSLIVILTVVVACILIGIMFLAWQSTENTDEPEETSTSAPAEEPANNQPVNEQVIDDEAAELEAIVDGIDDTADLPEEELTDTNLELE